MYTEALHKDLTDGKFILGHVTPTESIHNALHVGAQTRMIAPRMMVHDYRAMDGGSQLSCCG